MYRVYPCLCCLLRLLVFDVFFSGVVALYEKQDDGQICILWRRRVFVFLVISFPFVADGWFDWDLGLGGGVSFRWGRHIDRLYARLVFLVYGLGKYQNGVETDCVDEGFYEGTIYLILRDILSFLSAQDQGGC